MECLRLLHITVCRFALCGVSKHYVSTPTKLYFEDKCFLATGKRNRRQPDRLSARSDDRQNPHKANVLLAVVGGTQVHKAYVSAVIFILYFNSLLGL
jgi:hypothetical protein